MYDIMDEGFCLVDNIEEESRESLPQLPALYLYASYSISQHPSPNIGYYLTSRVPFSYFQPYSVRLKYQFAHSRFCVKASSLWQLQRVLYL